MWKDIDTDDVATEIVNNKLKLELFRLFCDK